MIVSIVLILMSQSIGEWLAFDETDNFDGSRRISAIQSAENDTLGDKPSLFMICDDTGGVTMHLYQRDEKRSYGSNQLPVAIKFGDGPHSIEGDQTNFWKADGTNLYYSGQDMAKFAERADVTNIVTLEVWTDRGKTSATFATEGTRDVYEYLKKNCPAAVAANSKLDSIDAID